MIYHYFFNSSSKSFMASAGMGANHLIFRESLFDTLASTVAGPGDGLKVLIPTIFPS